MTVSTRSSKAWGGVVLSLSGSCTPAYYSLAVLCSRQKQARARRQRIPAFGEWNYSYGGDWPVTQYLDSAVPPSPMPVKKVTESDLSPHSLSRLPFVLLVSRIVLLLASTSSVIQNAVTSEVTACIYQTCSATNRR
jgi:hypothetical protein